MARRPVPRHDGIRRRCPLPRRSGYAIVTCRDEICLHAQDCAERCPRRPKDDPLRAELLELADMARPLASLPSSAARALVAQLDPAEQDNLYLAMLAIDISETDDHYNEFLKVLAAQLAITSERYDSYRSNRS